MDWNGAIVLKIGLTQGLDVKRQKAATRETPEFSGILRQCLA
jgi:hypothetical protein